MEDQLVSFETAKLAKEKGFSEYTEHFWSADKKPRIDKGLEYQSDAYTKTNWNNGQGSYPTMPEKVSCSAPTQSLLQRWLREVKGIYVSPMFIGPDTNKHQCRIDIAESKMTGNYTKWFDTHEQALEFGLQEALQLIK